MPGADFNEQESIRKFEGQQSLPQTVNQTPASKRSSNFSVNALGNIRKRKRCPIDPEASVVLKYWDICTAVCLIFVCFVSPFEVAFLVGEADVVTTKFIERGANTLFWVNRAVDAIFFTDMVIQFFLMYPKSTQYGTTYVSSRKAIVKHYLKGWFLCDLLSILPYDFVGMIVGDDPNAAKDLSQLKVIRVVRLVRLLKLARLFRGMRILKRWELEMGFPYRKITLWVLLITVLLSAHWISCVLGIMNNLQGKMCTNSLDDDPECVETWFSNAASGIVSRGREVTPWRSYCAALYVSSTIIVHPHSMVAQNDEERGCFIVLIFLGGFLWTRVISKCTAITTSMNKHNILYHATMDDLNGISANMGLPKEMRKQLRAFFMNTRDSSLRSTWKDLLAKMSPSLRTQVAYHTNKVWLRRIPYFSMMSRIALQEIAMALKLEYFAMGESFGENFNLYVMMRGLCSWTRGVIRPKTSLLTPGTVWGEEHLLLTNWELLVPNTVKAVSFCEVNSIHRKSFEEIMQDHPEFASELSRFHRKYCFIRGVMRIAENNRIQKDGLDPIDWTHVDAEMRHRKTKAMRELQTSLADKSGRWSKTSLSEADQPEVSPLLEGTNGGPSPNFAMEGLREKLDELLVLTKGITDHMNSLEQRTTKLEESHRSCDGKLTSLQTTLGVVLDEISAVQRSLGSIRVAPQPAIKCCGSSYHLPAALKTTLTRDDTGAKLLHP